MHQEPAKKYPVGFLIGWSIHQYHMGNNFFTYVRHLEMLAFFSGYPLICYLIQLVSGNTASKTDRNKRFVSKLPLAYALIGTLFLTFLVSNVYPDFTFENIKLRNQQPALVIWGLLSLLFWIPAFFKRQFLSILHSLVFFFLIVKDLFFYLSGQVRDPDIVKNDMSVYTVSIFLNLAAYTFVLLFSRLLRFRKKYPGS